MVWRMLRTMKSPVSGEPLLVLESYAVWLPISVSVALAASTNAWNLAAMPLTSALASTVTASSFFATVSVTPAISPVKVLVLLVTL